MLALNLLAGADTAENWRKKREKNKRVKNLINWCHKHTSKAIQINQLYKQFN